jgi:dihydrofolate reductase
MPKLRAHSIAVSLDGYMSGPNQDLDNPLGVGGMRLHDWVFDTRTGRRMTGQDGGEEGLDDEFLARGDVGVGATIMGRNMFGPFRGPWEDEKWTGWWGEDPPYHHDVFVLTNHLRPSVTMQGGTVFHFVSDPIETVLALAFEAARGADVRLGGGADTIRQYLRAGLLDELHLAVVPILLGGGVRIFDDGGTPGYECAEFAASPSVAHYRLVRSA